MKMLTNEIKTSDALINMPAESEIVARNRRTMAAHLEEALKHHHNAAKYHEDGNYEKAHKSSIFALGHCCVARELLREDPRDNIVKDSK